MIWRQVEVPTSITLKGLHDVVQAAMGWCDYHLWGFTIGKHRYGLPMDCGGISGFYEALEAAADPSHGNCAEAKEWLTDYDPDTIDELPIKYALGPIANRRNPARARLAQKKPPSS